MYLPDKLWHLPHLNLASSIIRQTLCWLIAGQFRKWAKLNRNSWWLLAKLDRMGIVRITLIRWIPAIVQSGHRNNIETRIGFGAHIVKSKMVRIIDIYLQIVIKMWLDVLQIDSESAHWWFVDERVDTRWSHRIVVYAKYGGACRAKTVTKFAAHTACTIFACGSHTADTVRRSGRHWTWRCSFGRTLNMVHVVCHSARVSLPSPLPFSLITLAGRQNHDQFPTKSRGWTRDAVRWWPSWQISFPLPDGHDCSPCNRCHTASYVTKWHTSNCWNRLQQNEQLRWHHWLGQLEDGKSGFKYAQNYH